MSMSDIEQLQQEHDALIAEYREIGLPILDKAVEVSKKIRDLKRERGELFFLKVWRHHADYVEEADSLEDAIGMANAIADEGSGYVERIYGPGVDMQNHEWLR
jgi:hypothetical protein